MVYVISNNGQPLMPTKRHGKVRRLLKSGKAKVINSCPFTVQLQYESTTHTQDVSLGVDAGSKEIGMSVTTKKKELYASELTPRNDIVGLLSVRREARRTRRNRKTKYRKPRYLNRTHSKHKGWLAPSVEQKINTHLKAVEDVHKILPVNKITIETASFDTQLLKAMEECKPLPEGSDYQKGEMLGFFNTREYVLFRDNHTCQCCKGKSKDKILNVHHIISRKTGGDSPNNLITMCETCHKKYHRGEINFTPQKPKRYNDAAFMGIMRWEVYNRLKGIYPNVSMTYGYITKNTRIENGLEKTHHTDARCISGNPEAEPLGCYYRQKKVRCHNRQIHKFTTQKGGTRKRNQAPYEVKGFRLFDKVLYKGQECFIFGRRTSGSMDIRTLDGTKISPCAGYKNLKLKQMCKNILTEKVVTA